MAFSDDSISDNFIRMVQVLAEDASLRAWFYALKPMAVNLRQSVLETMVEEMKSDGEDPDLVTAIQSLMDPVVYEAALKTIAHMEK